MILLPALDRDTFYRRVVKHHGVPVLYSMTSATLKLLACGLMVVDHLGSIFFPQEPILRAIGRLAYPMFAYLIAEGYSHSKDKTSYLGRLFLFDP
jgi:hypothetical protein